MTIRVRKFTKKACLGAQLGLFQLSWLGVAILHFMFFSQEVLQMVSKELLDPYKLLRTIKTTIKAKKVTVKAYLGAELWPFQLLWLGIPILHCQILCFSAIRFSKWSTIKVR